MSIMNMLSITLVALILGAVLALYLGVRSASAAQVVPVELAPITATHTSAAL